MSSLICIFLKKALRQKKIEESDIIAVNIHPVQIFPLDTRVTYHESGNGVDGYTLVLPPRALVSVPEPAVRQTEAGVAGPDREGSHVVPVHVVREGKTPVLESYNKNKIGQSFYSKQCTFL